MLGLFSGQVEKPNFGHCLHTYIHTYLFTAQFIDYILIMYAGETLHEIPAHVKSLSPNSPGFFR